MLFELHPQNPDQRIIRKVTRLLEAGEVIVYPTDTIYSFGCSLLHKRAIERLAKLKGLRLKNAHFSIIFSDLSMLSEYTKSISRPVYKQLNKHLPGPFTFILPAASSISKLFETRKKTVGIRIPDHPIAQAIVQTLGHPLVTTSVHDEDELVAYPTDPVAIQEQWEQQVAAVIDAGYGKNIPSTVVDCSGEVPEVVRQGMGEWRE